MRVGGINTGSGVLDFVLLDSMKMVLWCRNVGVIPIMNWVIIFKFRCTSLRAFVGKYIQYTKLRGISNKTCYKNRAINTTVSFNLNLRVLFSVVYVHIRFFNLVTSPNSDVLIISLPQWLNLTEV